MSDKQNPMDDIHKARETLREAREALREALERLAVVAAAWDEARMHLDALERGRDAWEASMDL